MICFYAHCTFTFPGFQKQVDFLTLVKGNLPKSDSFQEILDYIYMHCDGRIGQGDLDARVYVLPLCLYNNFKEFLIYLNRQ